MCSSWLEIMAVTGLIYVIIGKNFLGYITFYLFHPFFCLFLKIGENPVDYW